MQFTELQHLPHFCRIIRVITYKLFEATQTMSVVAVSKSRIRSDAKCHEVRVYLLHYAMRVILIFDVFSRMHV